MIRQSGMKKTRQKRYWLTWALLLLAILALTPTVVAGSAGTQRPPTLQSIADKGLNMAAAESVVLSVEDATRVAVADPGVADIAVMGKSEVLVTAKAAGTTTLHVWDKRGLTTFIVRVIENEALAERVAAAIDRPELQVRMAGQRLILEGKLQDQNELQRALQIAQGYVTDVVSVVSLSHPLQVVMKVQVVEVNRTSTNQLGVTWGSVKRGVLEPNVAYFGELAMNLSMHRLDLIGGKIEALVDEGKARVLAAPAITALSGETAQFLAGGEIPIAIPDGEKVTVQFKEYGVRLAITPVVERDGELTIELAPEVSTLDWANGVRVNTAVLPALRTRRAQTKVRVKDSETLIIGGMLDKEDSQQIRKLPILGDLPIVGRLFRSEKFVKGETELLFFVTPRVLVEGETPDAEAILKPEPEAALEGGV